MVARSSAPAPKPSDSGPDSLVEQVPPSAVDADAEQATIGGSDDLFRRTVVAGIFGGDLSSTAGAAADWSGDSEAPRLGLTCSNCGTSSEDRYCSTGCESEALRDQREDEKYQEWKEGERDDEEAP
jgi:hypothetical protein